MALKRTVDPTELPLTLDEVRAHLRVTDRTEDPDLAGYLRETVDDLDGPEGLLNRALVTQTLEYTMDGFPAAPIGSRTPAGFDLPLPPLSSVSSITYIDTDGTSQTLAASKYRVLNAATPSKRGRVEQAYGETWPSVRSIAQSVTVTYVAGYGARNAVPEHIRGLIKVLIQMRYDHRDPLATASMVESPALRGMWARAIFPAIG